ncbi:MAG: sorbosone dehydrogenase family protein, partial [Pseudomonadota bacterium]|nr:sorbosone dehydrogenase family protein [Pseudomonadota bacterium]
MITACALPADQPVTIGIGPTPQLPPPSSPVIPTVNIAPAVGWPNGA